VQNTSGIVVVAPLAARAAGVLPMVAIHLTIDNVGCERGKLLVLAFRPPVLNGDVLPFNEIALLA
jgi:hypothetical protein